MSQSAKHQPRPGAWTGHQSAPLEVILLRHGQTEMSAKGQYSGCGSDPELTDFGKQQAAAAARYLAQRWQIEKIYTSPLTRTRQTAAAVAKVCDPAVEVLAHQGLRETDFGDWEGLAFAEARGRDPEFHANWLADPTMCAPGGESFAQTDRRVNDAANEIVAANLQEVEASPDGKPGAIVIVSHVTPIKAIIRVGLQCDYRIYRTLHLGLASVSTVLRYANGDATVTCINDTSHTLG